MSRGNENERAGTRRLRRGAGMVAAGLGAAGLLFVGVPAQAGLPDATSVVSQDGELSWDQDMRPGSDVWVEGTGFAPGSMVEMSLGGEVLASAAADEVGRVRFEWELAATTSVGANELLLAGNGVGGAVNLTGTVTVGAAIGAQAGETGAADPVAGAPTVSG